MECCQKYKDTLPGHVELAGDSDSNENLSTASMKSKHAPSAESLRTQSIASTKSEAGSEKSKEYFDTLETGDELIVEESYSELELEMVEEEEEYESSICSEWIVLKPDKKRRKKKEVAVESSVSDLNEAAGTRRLLKRPPSPEGEMFDDESRPKNLIPSNFFKYKNREEWPEPPPIEEALLKREPSPNMSFPRSRDDLELAGEDWLWFDGHYMESGDLEIHGEGEEYYRLPKQWKEGHWEPAAALLEKWEREEMELEKERQWALEENRKYEEIIKREDSPGMDVMNWGDGPVKMTAWMKCVGTKSFKDLSDILPTSISVLLEQIASDVSPEILKALLASVDEALMAENSLQMIQQLLEAYIAKGLDVLEDREKIKAALVQDSNMLDAKKPAMSLREITSSNKSVRFVEASLPAAAAAAAPEETEVVEEEYVGEEQLGEEAEEEQVPIIPRPKIIRDDPCDPLPESFRETLLLFIQDFVADKPCDPLVYAIGYFESRIPKVEDDIEQSLPGELDAISEVVPDRRLAAFHASSKQSSKESVDVEGEIEKYEKTPKETEILVRALNSCWVTRELDPATVTALVKAMDQIDVEKNEEIQSTDVEHDTFYVIKKGAFKLKNEYGTKILKDRGYFGELSLNAMVAESLKAPFSAIALKPGALWYLKRSDFLKIKDSVQKNKATVLFSMMGVMDLFDNLTKEEKNTVVDCLDMQYFKKKDIIFCQGSNPEGIYFFLNGVFKLIKITQGRGSADGRSVRTSSRNDAVEKQKFYKASTYQAPRLLGYGNFIENRPWNYSCVARSNIVQVAILKTDVFERLYGDPADVLLRPPPPPPRPKKEKFVDADGEAYGEHMEYYGEYHGEAMGEDAAPPPLPTPKVIPWLKKKVDLDPDEPPKPKQPPTYEEIMDAMWGTKPVYQHPKDSACMCGQCMNTVTCVGQGMSCCGKPKVLLEANK